MTNNRLVYFGGVALAILVGCASQESTFERERAAGSQGYPAPSWRGDKYAVGCANFVNRTRSEEDLGDIGSNAAEQMSSLLPNTRRFRVIEREQLPNILREQELEGIVNVAELPQQAQVSGLDLVCYGAITDYEVRKYEQSMSTHGVTQAFAGAAGVAGTTNLVGGVGTSQLTSIDWTEVEIQVRIGVDVKIADTTTGEIYVSGPSEVRRTESASAFGFELAGIGMSNDGTSIQLDRANQGKLLRIALDGWIQDNLGNIDAWYEDQIASGRRPMRSQAQGGSSSGGGGASGGSGGY